MTKEHIPDWCENIFDRQIKTRITDQYSRQTKTTVKVIYEQILDFEPLLQRYVSDGYSIVNSGVYTSATVEHVENSNTEKDITLHSNKMWAILQKIEEV